MKNLLAITIILILFAVTAYTEDITVYDYSTGQFSYYDVVRRGRNVEVYDWKNGKFMEFDIERNGDIYNWNNNTSYDVEMRRNCRGGLAEGYQDY